MIHISQEELLRKIEQEHNELISKREKKLISQTGEKPEDRKELTSTTASTFASTLKDCEDMTSSSTTILSSATFRDGNNNSISSNSLSSSLQATDEDEVQAVLITGNYLEIYLSNFP